MESLKWLLVFVFLSFKVIQTETSSWTIKVPSSVKGLLGSCVVIPCSFNYPDPGKTVSAFTGMWTDASNHLICHTDVSKIMQQYRNRINLVGDVRQKNCSLKIDPLQQSDLQQGPFHFRIEIEGYDKYSWKEHTVSITMSEPNPITFSMEEEVVEHQNVSASCFVSHSCPASPEFTWSHPGEEQVQLLQLEDGQWKTTSNLTFRATSADDNKSLQCTVTYKGGQKQNKSKILKVKYTPKNVKVEYKSDAKEGEDVRLKCSSDAHPPVDSYVWYNETADRVYEGDIYTLQNVSRNTGALYCTASNALGQGKSSSVLINVLYAPDFKTSSCSSEADMVKCVCTVESRPPSMVQFVLSDRVLPITKVEKHDSVTIGTLQAKLGSFEFVLCLANNTQGNANLSLSLPVDSNMQTIVIIAAGAGAVVVILLIAVCVVVKKSRGRSGDAPTPHMSNIKADKDVDLKYAATTRKEKNYDDAYCPEVYANDHVYGNMETDEDDAIYANV